MRRLALLAGLTLAASCGQSEPPPPTLPIVAAPATDAEVERFVTYENCRKGVVPNAVMMVNNEFVGVYDALFLVYVADDEVCWVDVA